MKRVCFFTALLIAVAFLSFEKSYAIDPDCLEIVLGNDGYSSENLDSIMVDTCTNSPTYNKWYAKKGIVIRFYDYPFIEEPIPINIIKYWYDIDTNLALLKERLQNISNKYGIFTIIRETKDEFSHLYRKDFTLTFENYICFDSLCYDIIDSSANVWSINFRFVPEKLDVKENNYNPIIYNEDNILKINCSLSINSKIKLIDIYGNIYNTNFEIMDNTVNINISNLSIGVYFIQIDNLKPIKFIKYLGS